MAQFVISHFRRRFRSSVRARGMSYGMAPPYGETIWQTHAEWLASPCFLRGLRLSPPTPEKINAKKKTNIDFTKVDQSADYHRQER